MDFALTEDQRMIREAVGKLSQRYGRAYFLEKTEKGEDTGELWKELGDSGFLGTLIPEEHGGSALGLVEMELFLESMAEHGMPLLFLVVSSVMGTLALTKHGTDEQKKRFLPDLASGKTKFAFAITEPDAGSNSFRITTKATRVGDCYSLTGRKTYISGADRADYILLVARTTPYDDPALKDKRLGMSLFIVPANAPGLERSRIPVAIEGPESQFLLFLDDVKVPAANRVGPEGAAAAHLFDVLNAERIAVAAFGVGIGRYVLDKAVKYANERQVFDVPIGAHQGLAHPMAKAKCRVELAALMTQKAAWLVDRGLKAGAESNIAKYEAAEAAIEACDVAIQVHGGNGFSREFDVITIWPWARLLRTAPVSREMILNYVAEHVLGLPRSS